MLENKTQSIDYLDLILEGICNNDIEIYTDEEFKEFQKRDDYFTHKYLYTQDEHLSHEQSQAEYDYNKVIVCAQDTSFKAGFRVAVQLLLGSQK